MTLWAVLLAGWACAGPVEVSGTPVAAVQLSLALSPNAVEAARFEVIEAVSQIPVPAMPAAVASAWRAGDARGFYLAAQAADYAPPESDEHQLALLEEGAARERAEQAFYDAIAERLGPKAKRRAGAKIDYASFGQALRRHPGLSSSVFGHAAAKRAILKAAGYTRLRGRGNTSVPIDEASDARIGRAFAHVYAQYERR